ncbi:biosynthetic arginine decarboxylase [Planctomyces sp. SH-PL14]|uniref:biosynthetic arginine decarboxylase n=1 Tax=Planctomyces sp. SH-PL14 TaxID=1632864 RepID=UPI00078C4D15|nr:biosynthetic arginine decarboxylase [Planctomyces sp. SH-PL14]AMV19341.1 Biosynthetic arginine decarboxylase [Planctomyces sp. SH-PL14]
MIEPAESWSVTDSSELYDVPRWGKGYFSVGKNGHLLAHPDRNSARAIDLKELVDRLQMRGLYLPILVRFNGILKDRLQEMHDIFATAMKEHDYKGGYSCVYPIKVNQQREVVEKIVEYGHKLNFGLEAGSKPELLAVIAMTAPHTPIICNGFKDDEFIEMAMLATKIGRNVIPVVEKATELDLILKYCEKVGVRPQIGMRVKLATRGSGRWQSSGGYRSKFGLTVSEILKCFQKLEAAGMTDCFQLLHFHQGSQITNIRQVKHAVNEAVRIYCDLYKRGAGLKYLDIGGGLGVDYDGSQTNFESSMNYSVHEYARDVIHHVSTVCDEAQVPHPTIVSESGRAVVAYHAALIFGTMGTAEQGAVAEIPKEMPEESEQPLHDLFNTYNAVNIRNALESYHDAQQALDMVNNLFSTGYLPLTQRVVAENLFFAICHKIRKLSQEMDYVPDELANLDRMLSDTYFCNFSLFQSMPDSWAIKQLFPVMPIHRLEQQPTRHAVISDITCDSDGKIDCFIDQRDVKKTLMLHPFKEEQPYYLGAFLIGAYQEILGDLHNLFGDTNAVHVDLNESGEVELHAIIKGDTVNEVLDYVQFKGRDLIDRLQMAVELAVREGRIDHVQAGRFVKFYEDGLNGYTYLEEPGE